MLCPFNNRYSVAKLKVCEQQKWDLRFWELFYSSIQRRNSHKLRLGFARTIIRKGKVYTGFRTRTIGVCADLKSADKTVGSRSTSYKQHPLDKFDTAAINLAL